MKPNMSDNNTNQIITRFPPSPTGPFHIGNVRTALYNFLFARHHNGKLLFRSEDTDLERSTREFENEIIEGLKWLGIDYDNKEGIIRQSDRTDIYKSYLEKLISSGKAYVSREDSKINPGQEVDVIRFKNPKIKIKFTDEIRGEIEFDTTELGDFVIARNMDEPLYHLSVVIDDYEMGINFILRGEDGISNTPRQILIQEAIGAPRPRYAHLPLVMAPDKSKLSKRKHGESVSLNFYKKRGYLPEAINNYLALLGWNPGTPQEIFSLSELISEFDINKIQKSSAIFDLEKLNWINKEHLKKLDWEVVESEIIKALDTPPEQARRLAPTVFERINCYGDIEDMKTSGELDYVYNEPSIDVKGLMWTKSKTSKAGTSTYLTDIIEMLGNIEDSDFSSDKIKEIIFPYAKEKGTGDVLWAMRYALSGKEKSPDPFTLAYILGRDIAINRLRAAATILAGE
jgi:glutamyl-tRNA synthetase